MRHRPGMLAALAALTVALGGIALPASALSGPAAPAGLTGMALDGTVELAWQPVTGAASYNVYRGTNPNSVTTLLTSPGVTGTMFDDTTAQDGATYYYAVRAVASGVESSNSATVQATAEARACSTGNTVVLENCFPGNSPWDVRNTATVAAGGIEGFATAASINKGQSVALKVNSSDQTTFHIEVYRTGYYGGAEARLFSVIHGIRGTLQPGCVTDSSTGLVDCSDWSVSYMLTTTANWPSGAYVLRLVRDDNGTDNQILLVVRDDSRKSDLLYGVAVSNYQSYNNYGGKSLYDFNSNGSNTIAGSPRAVKVSYDRPFEQPRSGQRDWYTRNEMGTVSWLEQSGYDVAYVSNTDLETNGSLLLSHKAYLSAAHDEYWSAGMRSAAKQARDSGVDLFFSGSNEVYWKIRFENSPVTGAAGRVQVCYKSTQRNPDGTYAPPDPSGIPTGTWRDPNGANQPENALTGEMYVGDNDNKYFPLVVPAADGTDRVFRYTPLSTQAPGTSTSLGASLVGWEWDARVANGQEPVGVKTLTESPVTGNLIQANGGFQVAGSATVSAVKYTAPSGALVFTTGTNHWARGLGLNAAGVGEPNQNIQQVTTNVLEDMGVVPATSAANITLDNPNTARPSAPTGLTANGMGSDHIMLQWNAVSGVQGYNVYRSTAPRQNGQPLGQLANAGLITGTSFTDMGLPPSTTYYYVVTSVANGVQSLASSEASATTLSAIGEPVYINSGGPAYTSSTGQMYVADNYFSGGLTHSTTAPITGTNDSALYQDERYGAMTYTVTGLANEMYDVYLHFAELYYGSTVPGSCVGKRIFSVNVNNAATPQIQNLDICALVGPDAALTENVSGVMVQGGSLSIQFIKGAADDPEVTAIDVVPMHMSGNPTVTDTSPADGSSNASLLTQPSATFSEMMDPTTINSSSFTVTAAGGTPVLGSVGYDGTTNSATFVPSGPLAYGTTYTATLSTDVMSMDGMPLMAPVSWTFTTLQAVAPTLTDSFPADGATGMSMDSMIHVSFSKNMDPTTITDMSFTAMDPMGMQVMGMVSYDPTTKTAMLMPDQPLDPSTMYEVHLDTSITAADGIPLASPIGFGFTTASGPLTPPTVVAQTPAPNATSVARSTTVTATFSVPMHGDPSIFNTETFTLTGPNGVVASTVAYDSTTLMATLTPAQPLGPGTYTARLDSMIHALDGEPLGAPVSWSFTTIPPPSVTSTAPANAAGYVSQGGSVQASFSRAMDPATLTASAFTLSGPSGAVAGAVSYNGTTNTATFTPNGLLQGGATYTATVAASAADSSGVPMGTPYSWSFSTAACPCQLFPITAAPSATSSVQDGRTGPGPWSYELGVKATVDEPMQMTAIRFYKAAGETGIHTGTVWTTSGVKLATVTFSNETASGWQQQALATPLSLQAGTTYVVSVNANAHFPSTKFGLLNQVVSGPLRTVADGKNGVYGSSAGTFPSSTYSSTNYYVDFQAVVPGTPVPPSLTANAPANNATGVSRTAAVSATFSRAMDASSVNASTFTLQSPNGALVPAAVAYNATTNTATLTPSSPLSYSTAYTAWISGSVRASDGMTMGAPAQWTFTIAAPVPPTVTLTVPQNGATDAGAGVTPSATFSKSLNPYTVTASTFTLTDAGGNLVPATVAYTDSSYTATLTPTSPLLPGTYAAHLDPSIASTDGAMLGTPYVWTFTVPSLLPPLTVNSTTPAAGATAISRATAVQIVFNRTLDPRTMTASTVNLTTGGTAVPASLAYDGTANTVTITPSAVLAASTVYTVNVTTGLLASDETPLGTAWSSSFTTSTCPCMLLPTAVPAKTSLGVQDGRFGPGPWSYEMGIKITVSKAASLTAIRFYKSLGETGAHTGTLWSAGGTKLATVTFASETASGWQQATLSTPYQLQVNTTYVVSVNMNKYYVDTISGLASQIVSGPLASVADGKNGVFGSAAGVFPASSYSSSNYFIDAVVQ